jgi:glycosyltransferase involved in cell wall biosynthesis
MRWSAVIPVYNEARFLPATIESLARQDRPLRLIIVDNGSTDEGIPQARRQVAELGVDTLFLSEPTPGQVHALRRGIASVATEYVAICDADSWYPPHYLARAEALFLNRGRSCVAVAACLRKSSSPHRLDWNSLRQLVAARLMPRQNHTSGAAHCFRTASLRAAGGYDADLWPYVLKDHELMHRMLKLGGLAWHHDLWCTSSDRRQDRSHCRWTLGERIAYHLTPFASKDRFFAELARRFETRGQRDVVLRERGWEALQQVAR